jgi:hypothetical protein
MPSRTAAEVRSYPLSAAVVVVAAAAAVVAAAVDSLAAQVSEATPTQRALATTRGYAAAAPAPAARPLHRQQQRVAPEPVSALSDPADRPRPWRSPPPETGGPGSMPWLRAEQAEFRRQGQLSSASAEQSALPGYAIEALALLILPHTLLEGATGDELAMFLLQGIRRHGRGVSDRLLTCQN